MTYRITEVRHRAWPDDSAVERALAEFGVGIEDFRGLLASCVHPNLPAPDRGFQLELGPTIKSHLYQNLADRSKLKPASRAYSPRLNEEADLAFGSPDSERRLYIEIEFRPNVEKDLVKFQIGANTGWLGAAVLVLTLDRNCVNPGYTTMPEFTKFERVIDELRPGYPLLVLGFAGQQDGSSDRAERR